MSVIAEFLKSRFYPPADTKPSFAGQIVIVTGANTGLGCEAALKFVRLGAARVILAVRTPKKGEDAKSRIESVTGRKGVLEVWELEMLSYPSVKSFAARASRELEHLDYAILNAGVVMATYQTSPNGWETTLQINLLSTTLLALLLLPKMRAAKTKHSMPVLELVSSGNAYLFDELLDDGKGSLAAYNDPKNFDFVRQYGITKVLLEFAKAGLTKLAGSQHGNVGETIDSEPDVYIISVCPGATKSELARDHKALSMRAILRVLKMFQRSTEQGARTYISGVTQGKDGHGGFWQHDRLRE